MHDRDKSTLPGTPAPPDIPDWEAHGPFREAFLHRLAEEDAEAIRHVGRFFHDLALEAAVLLPTYPESETRRELGAALKDAAYLRDLLAAIGREVEQSELDVEDVKLSLLASELAVAVSRVADALAEGLR